jgi:hypothetical protein
MAMATPPKSETNEAVKKKSYRRWLALASILLLLLVLGFYFLRPGGSGQKTPFAGDWVVDRDAAAPAPGDLALVFRGKGASRSNVRAWIKDGTWKIIEKSGQKVTVEISNPKGSPERLQIVVPDGEPLQIAVQDGQRAPSSFLQKPDKLGLGKGPRMLRPSLGEPLHGTGSSSTKKGANYSLIETALYQGGLVPEPPPGTQEVINLCESLDQYQGAIPSYHWVPIADAAPAPSLNWLKEMVGTIDAGRQHGQTVYVHCHAGISRSGMLVTAYCMFEHGWTRDKALDFVRSKRPVTRPNPAFMELLTQWQQFLQGQASADKVPAIAGHAAQ